jgi:hypothetical protein
MHKSCSHDARVLQSPCKLSISTFAKLLYFPKNNENMFSVLGFSVSDKLTRSSFLAFIKIEVISFLADFHAP